MAVKVKLLIISLISILIALCRSEIEFEVRNSNPSGHSCTTSLDCGSNIKYEVCSRIDSSTKKAVECKGSSSDSGCKCNPCNSDSLCDINKQNDVCVDEHWCEMKALMDSFQTETVLTIIAIFVGAFIAAGGGLGGGGIFVPVYIILLRFDAKSAAALSQATIFGGSMVNFWMNSRQRHPNRPHRPLTDFNTILILEPMLLGGTVIGVLLNQLLPDPIILVCLLLVLIIALYRMVKKGRSQWKKENEEKARGLLSGGSTASATMSRPLNEPSMSSSARKSLSTEAAGSRHRKLLDEEYGVDIVRAVAAKCGQPPVILKDALSDEELYELDLLMDQEGSVWRPMLWMVMVWIIVSVFALLRAGTVMNVETCSMEYWLFEFGVFPCLFVITFLIARANSKRFQRKLELKWKPAEGDIEWNLKKSIIYPSIAALSGLLGGLLGIGGGMILSPLLLELGVLPRVASATSALAVLMTSSSSTFQKVLNDMIRYDYMAFFGAVGIIGTFIGQTVVNVAIKKYGRNSIVIAAVASVIAVAIVLMATNSILDMNWTFALNSIC